MEEKNDSLTNPSGYDFEFITQSLGLVPIQDREAAINPQMLTDICRADDNEGWIFSLEGGESYILTDEEMIDLENIIRARAESVKAMRKEALESDVRTQLEAHAKTVAELNAGLQAGGGIIVNTQPNKRFRQ